MSSDILKFFLNNVDMLKYFGIVNSYAANCRRGSLQIDDSKKEASAMTTCFVCGQDISRMQKRLQFYDGRDLHEACLDQAIAALHESIPLTSTHQVEGHRIVKYLDIISGETVIGTGLFSDFKGKLGSAKRMALQRLSGAALSLGANAVIGVDLDYATLSSDKIAVVASGTAVKMEWLQ
jgi:uncharacterized protein YbjQ (UPF0145 family)